MMANAYNNIQYCIFHVQWARSFITGLDHYQPAFPHQVMTTSGRTVAHFATREDAEKWCEANPWR